MPTATPTLGPIEPTSSQLGARNSAISSQGGALPGADISKQGQAGYDVFGNFVGASPTYVTPPGTDPNAPTKEITSISSDGVSPSIQANNQTMNNISSSPVGNQTDTTGVQRYSNGNLATAPSGAVQETDENGKPISVWKDVSGKTYGLGPSLGMDPVQQSLNDQIETLKSQAKGTLVTTFSNIQNRYNDIIKKQQLINSSAEAGLDKSLLMGGSSRFSASAGGISASMKSFDLDEITGWVNKENDAIAAAQLAYDNNNNQLVDKQLAIAKDASDNQQKAAQKMLDVLSKVQQETAEKQKQARIDTAVSSELSSGNTDPSSIITNLKAQGLTVTAKDIADTISNLNPNAKEVQSILTEAAKNTAPADVLKAIGQSKDLNSAIAAAGRYLQDPTSNAGQYQTAVQGGYKGTYQDWFAAKQYRDQYSQAKASAQAKADVDNANNPDTSGTLTDPSKGGILNQTGLSIQAFNYLTQGTSALTRMTAGERAKFMNEANSFLNKNGIDISTFQSQYKAYNDTVQKNIARANQTKIQAGEVEGSADALLSAIDEKDMSSIRAANILDLMAGKQVNDPTTQKYSTQLRLMANDLAGYFAAARGATSPELQDQRDAADIIERGMNAGTVNAFKESIKSNEEKVSAVVNNAVSNSQKSVWGLFGVGDRFNPVVTQTPEQIDTDVKNKLVDFYNKTTDNAKMIDEIHAAFPTMSAIDIAKKLKLIQ